MIATFVIFLREGVEASMIVAILLAYLDRIDQRQHFRDVFIGVGAAMVLVTGGGVAAYLTLTTYAGSRTQTIFETVTYLIAAVVLTYMTFWMRSHARSLSADLRARTDAALDGRTRFGLGTLAFQAVGREGLETMVFTLAIVFASSAKGVIVGGIAGLIVSLGIAFAIYHLGRRLNIAAFFKALGALLVVFAAGILADAVENVQQLGWIRFLDHPVWNTSGVLSEDSTVGDIFHTFLGYSDRPSVLQLVIYVAYLVVTLSAFIGLRKHLLSLRGAGSAASGAAGSGHEESLGAAPDSDRLTDGATAGTAPTRATLQESIGSGPR